MRANGILLVALALLAACAGPTASWDPSASSLDRTASDCVRNGGTPDTLCTDNIKSLAMVFGAIESAETGKSVEITW